MFLKSGGNRGTVFWDVVNVPIKEAFQVPCCHFVVPDGFPRALAVDLQAMARAGGVPDSGLLDGSDCGGRGGPKMRGDDGGPDPHGPHGEPPFPGFHGGSGFQGLPVFGAGYGAAQGQGFKPPPVKVRGLLGSFVGEGKRWHVHDAGGGV